MRNRPPSWSFPVRKFRVMAEESDTSEVPPPMGGGRSYGDSNFLNRKLNKKQRFFSMEIDLSKNIASFGASVSIHQALNFLLSYNLTLPVVPGTIHATIGGCIASDVHGKNAHTQGCFSEHLMSFDLQISAKQTLRVEEKNSVVWKSTIGGQGLSGTIVSAKIRVIPLKSTKLESTTIVTKNLEEIFAQMTKNAGEFEFLIGWVDGETKTKGENGYIELCRESLQPSSCTPVSTRCIWKANYPRIPVINHLTISLFNYMTHFKVLGKTNGVFTRNRWEYLFPLAKLGNWNYFFGKNGFHEVQFSCDDLNLAQCIKLMRNIISEQTTFLIGIKLMKQVQTGYLGFPGQPWSIAIAFPASKFSSIQVQQYYNKIIEFGGKVNLTKDWVMTAEQFAAMYPKYKELVEFRDSLGLKSQSNFARRVRIL